MLLFYGILGCVLLYSDKIVYLLPFGFMRIVNGDIVGMVSRSL